MHRSNNPIIHYAGSPGDKWHEGARNHTTEFGCYFCKPEHFPPMPDYWTLCFVCGNVIRIRDIDPMNEGMEACIECEDRFEEEERASNAQT